MTGELDPSQTGSMSPDARQSLIHGILKTSKVLVVDGPISIVKAMGGAVYAIFHKEESADEIVELEPGKHLK